MKRIAVVLGTGVVGLSWLVAACDRNAQATVAAAPAGPQAVGSSSAETPNYKIELKPAGAYKKGEVGSYEIIVKTKGEYHVNEEFPTKFKAAETQGVAYAQPKLERLKDGSAFALEKCSKDSKDSCTMKVTIKFTPQPNATKVAGELSFGVCNKDSCLIEKKALDGDIKVN